MITSSIIPIVVKEISPERDCEQIPEQHLQGEKSVSVKTGGAHFTYTYFQWTEGMQSFQIQYLTLDT